MSKEFQVALSFPGEHREQTVEPIARVLAQSLSEQRVFYDASYKGDLARLNLDVHLLEIYRDRSDLIVVFLCQAYNEKEWCGLELRGIRDLIKQGHTDRIIPVRLDDAEVSGFLSIDGYLDARKLTPEQIAAEILTRLPQAEPGSTKPNNLRHDSLGKRFKGRDEYIQQLHTLLHSTPANADTQHAAAITAARAVHGMGGVGKTRAAIEYAWRYQDEYSALLFIPADSPERLKSNLVQLTQVLPGLSGLHQSADEARLDAVEKWFREHADWLVILDNVDDKDASKAVLEWLPQLRNGHVLITSRISKWKKVAGLSLDVLSETAAVDYLLEETIDDRLTHDDDSHTAKLIANELGRLVLGLEHAAAYIINHELSLQEYLDQFRANADHVLELEDDQLIDYPRPILKTWSLSVQRLSEPARLLLEMLSWFAPDDIPETLLDSTPDSFPIEPAKEVLSELVRYSLAWRDRTAENPCFGLHRLVQTATRYHAVRDSEATTAPASLRHSLNWINHAFQGDPQDVRSWPVLDPLSSHANEIAHHADKAGLVDAESPTSVLLNQLAVLYLTKARYELAEPLMRRALAIDEQSYGAEHPNVANTLNNLAQLLQDTNRLAEAEPLMRRALAIDEQSYGAEHPNVALKAWVLAVLLRDTGRLREALPLMERASQIYQHFETVSGFQHPDWTGFQTFHSQMREAARGPE